MTSAATVDQIRSPYDDSVVVEMPVAGEAEVEAAIVAAQRGFGGGARIDLAHADIDQQQAGARRTTVCGVLAPGVLVEIDVVAFVG